VLTAVLATLALVWMLVLRFTVRVLQPTGENGGDDALAHTLFMGAMYWPVRWLLQQDPWLATLGIPVLIALAHTNSVRVIYRTDWRRSLAISSLHAALTTLMVGGLAVTTAIVAAYIMYGRIVRDPMLLIRALLRLIGIEI
jgi:hypothetical protein